MKAFGNIDSNQDGAVGGGSSSLLTNQSTAVQSLDFDIMMDQENVKKEILDEESMLS
jgi:hypothetical protein